MLWTFICRLLCEHLFSVLLNRYLGVELWGHRIVLFSFLSNCQTVFHSACPILHSKSPVYESSNISISSPTLNIFFKNIFIYLFLAVRGLCFCAGFLWLWWAGAALSCGAWAPYCGGSFLLGSVAQGAWALAVASPGVWSTVHSCGARA